MTDNTNNSNSISPVFLLECKLVKSEDVLNTKSTKQVNVTVYNPRLSRSEVVEGLGIWIFKSYQSGVVEVVSLQRCLVLLYVLLSSLMLKSLHEEVKEVKSRSNARNINFTKNVCFSIQEFLLQCL